MEILYVILIAAPDLLICVCAFLALLMTGIRRFVCRTGARTEISGHEDGVS